MPRLSGWQVVGITFATLLVVMSLSILTYSLSAPHPPELGADGYVEMPLFQVGPAEVAAAFFNFAFLVSLLAFLVSYFRGNRRAAFRWLLVAFGSIAIALAAFFLGAAGAPRLG